MDTIPISIASVHFCILCQANLVILIEMNDGVENEREWEADQASGSSVWVVRITIFFQILISRTGC